LLANNVVVCGRATSPFAGEQFHRWPASNVTFCLNDSMDTDTLIACPECDALHSRVSLSRLSSARCSRCDAVLYQQSSGKLERILALLLTTLITLGIANGFPIVELQSNGFSTRTTLIGAVGHLWSDGEPLVAAIVLASTVVVPLLEVLAMLWLIVPMHRGRRPQHYAPVLRTIQAIRPWGMIEVFMLGVLVTLVKLSDLARVIPEAALFAFGTVTFLLALIMAFDLRQLWEIAQALPEAAPARRRPAPAARKRTVRP
jgi:paraquat-inducible protein A